jgi:hypothetical protein
MGASGMKDRVKGFVARRRTDLGSAQLFGDRVAGSELCVALGY